MAVRNDFTAGEVLAAADLNDTFAEKLPYSYGTATPSTTDSGFLWYDSNSTPPTAKYWNGSSFATFGALTLITSETVASGTSSVSLNNVFTSSFRNYMFTLDLLGSTTLGVRFRMRASGSDDAGTNYDRQNLTALSLTVSGSAATDETQATAGATSTRWASNILYVAEPAIARFTRYKADLIYSDPPQYDLIIGYHTLNTAYDGITFFTSTGTMQGIIKVYGLQ